MLSEWEKTNLIHPPDPWWERRGTPSFTGQHTVYLAGTMDPDGPDWRETVTEVLSEGGTQRNIVVLDPRLDGYEPLWHQNEDPRLLSLFDWEMRGIQLADQVVFHFEPGTRSPISLLELGIVHLRGPQVIVHCPRGYWRRDYVRLFCERFQITMKDDLRDLGELARYRL